jgi:hypothetical protein
MVPLVVIVPPVKPVPAVIEVTVPEPPPPPVAVIVVIPLTVVRVMPGPAARTWEGSLVKVGVPWTVKSMPAPNSILNQGPLAKKVSG